MQRLVLVLVPFLALAQALLEQRITEFTLENGLHFLVYERHEVPVISFHTYVKAGSVNDPAGQTGLAHMFERLAYKGTDTIGTRNWAGEKQALAAVEEALDRLDIERRKGHGADSSRISLYEGQARLALSKASVHIQHQEMPQLIESNGGTGLNATTGVDATEFTCSLPSNRIELWFYLESQRLQRPVFREFYKERDEALADYRRRVETTLQGQMAQTFLATAFAAHPYRHLSIGWPSDLERLRASDAERFFRTYYTPSNITIAIAGDADPAQVKLLAQKYFGPIPAGLPPPLVTTREPPQLGPKLAQLPSAGDPLLYIGYKRPDQNHKDDPVFDVIAGLLGGGRAGMLHSELVEEKKLATGAGVQPGYPGMQHESLFVIIVAAGRGSKAEENEAAVYDLLARLRSQPVDEAALGRAKAHIRASVLRRLESNPSAASLLATSLALYGSWKRLFAVLDEIDKVTAGDVQRVAQHYFVPARRTVAYTLRAPAGADR